MNYTAADEAILINTEVLGTVRLACGHYGVAEDYFTLKITVESIHTSKPVPDAPKEPVKCCWCGKCEDFSFEDEPYDDSEVNKPEGEG